MLKNKRDADGFENFRVLVVIAPSCPEDDPVRAKGPVEKR